MIEDERVLARLGRDETEARNRFLECGVDLRVAEALATLALLALGIRLSHRSVDDDRAGESVAVQRGRDDADQAAHAVPDEHGRAHEACVRDDGENFVGPLTSGILRTATALSMAAQIERDDVVPPGQHRCEKRPPLDVRGAPVDQNEPRFDSVSPAHVVNRAAGDLDDVVGARGG